MQKRWHWQCNAETFWRQLIWAYKVALIWFSLYARWWSYLMGFLDPSPWLCQIRWRDRIRERIWICSIFWRNAICARNWQRTTLSFSQMGSRGQNKHSFDFSRSSYGISEAWKRHGATAFSLSDSAIYRLRTNLSVTSLCPKKSYSTHRFHVSSSHQYRSF